MDPRSLVVLATLFFRYCALSGPGGPPPAGRSKGVLVEWGNNAGGGASFRPQFPFALRPAVLPFGVSINTVAIRSEDFWGIMFFRPLPWAKGVCREATSEISQTCQCLVARPIEFVLKGRWTGRAVAFHRPFRTWDRLGRCQSSRCHLAFK